ncbi:hypothetical protein DL98DRAFT_662289 [Cadophora sp. DSE1049]|nr:hypothetical protein DL98DRAFT_662289 [Cadophora sp. DSE1049]
MVTVDHILQPVVEKATTSTPTIKKLAPMGKGAAKRLCDSNSDQHDNNIPQTNLGNSTQPGQEIATEMIVTSPGISGSAAENARASLDAQVAQLQADGMLEPGKSSHEKLNWTDETIAAAQEFKTTVDLTPLKDLGIAAKQEDIQWRIPIVYSDVVSDPLKYDRSGPGKGIIGILALGTVHLPEYGDSGTREIQSGSAAYFLESDPVVEAAHWHTH